MLHLEAVGKIGLNQIKEVKRDWFEVFSGIYRYVLWERLEILKRVN